MDLAPLDDREVPQNVDECLADAFASVHYAENRLIDGIGLRSTGTIPT